MNNKFREKVKNYLSLNEMAMKHFGPEAEKKYSKEELKELFNNTSVSNLADTYVRNARADGMEDKKIAQGLGATLRGMEDKDKVAKVKEAVKEKLDLAGKKKEEKKEESRIYRGRTLSEASQNALQKLEQKHKEGRLPAAALTNSKAYKELRGKFGKASSKQAFKSELKKKGVSDKFAERIISSLMRDKKEGLIESSEAKKKAN